MVNQLTESSFPLRYKPNETTSSARFEAIHLQITADLVNVLSRPRRILLLAIIKTVAAFSANISRSDSCTGPAHLRTAQDEVKTGTTYFSKSKISAQERSHADKKTVF